jgi:hypothetical protein
MENLPRDFKGIWISREIWLDQSLTYFEKCLLAEIHSLNGPDGCFASNEYLCNFFNERERKIQDGLAKLKAKGYLYIESFDGRTRVLRTSLTPNNDKSLFSTSGVSDSAPLPCQNPHPSLGKDTLYREKIDKKEKHAARGAFSFTNEENKQLACFTPEQLKQAYQILHDECKAKSEESRKKFLFAVLNRMKTDVKKPKLSVYEELKQHFNNGDFYNEAICDLTTEGIGFSRGMKQDQQLINKYWSWDKFKSLCDDFEIPFTRA